MDAQVGGEHALGRGHGVGPEEVVVEGVVTVDALGGSNTSSLCDESEARGLARRPSACPSPSLLALDQLHFLKQLVLVHIWPHLG